MTRRFTQFFSMDSAKAIKAAKYRYLNAINYMAPANQAGVGNLCPHASPGCLALCLGWYSGQAAMLTNAELETGNNPVRDSRKAKAVMFMKDRASFMCELVAGIEAAQRRAQRLQFKLCVRLNGSTDIAWEGVRIPNWRTVSVHESNVFEAFSDVQFVDYTKSVKRALRAATDPTWPKNYHLTFSRSETNEGDCEKVLAAGGNVAVVFEVKPDIGSFFMSSLVIDGDETDLRHLDIQASRLRTNRGFIVALSPKGRKAKNDQSGFVVR